MHYVVACDPDRGGRELLRAVARLVGSDDRVTVVHVVNPLGEPWHDRERVLSDAVEVVIDRDRKAILALMAEEALHATVVVESTREDEHSAPAIARLARASGADMLVVMSKRASGLLGMLLGSVAQALLTLSPCPVLVIRPDDTQRFAPTPAGRNA